MNVRYFKVGMYYKWNMLRAFPLEILLKNIKLPLLKNLHLQTKKNRTSSVYMLE